MLKYNYELFKDYLYFKLLVISSKVLIISISKNKIPWLKKQIEGRIELFLSDCEE